MPKSLGDISHSHVKSSLNLLKFGVTNYPGWGPDACGQWSHHSCVWKAGSSWPLLGVCLCLFSCLHLCLYGRCCWVLGTVIEGVVGVVGVVVIMGIVVGIVVVAVGIAVVLVVLVEAMVMVVMFHIHMINKHMLNKQTTRIPLHSVPVNSAEHSGLNSGMPKFCWNDQAPE